MIGLFNLCALSEQDASEASKSNRFAKHEFDNSIFQKEQVDPIKPGLGNVRRIVLQNNSVLTELQGISQNISTGEFYWRELVNSTNTQYWFRIGIVGNCSAQAKNFTNIFKMARIGIGMFLTKSELSELVLVFYCIQK